MKELLKYQFIGKVLPTDIYVHKDYLNKDIEELLLRVRLKHNIDRDSYTILKLCKKGKSVSFLSYPDFETHPHPSLTKSVKVNLETGEMKVIDYSKRANPPILHRKECFVGEEHPRRVQWESLTLLEESKGWYKNTRVIGTRNGWLKVTGG